ncbi:MAG TPA: helix-turn-helix domain-containing protein [Streptosporangiaceae bacterium]|nr:helix-turn-helix domain-containing protein [Streptosporangiaceae bacterium]
MGRLTRAEQAERNRGLVLAAARRVFLARGYHGATLEQIAEEAGFSKGVVYSQFEGKADLFLALLEARISERAAENAAVAGSLHDGDLRALFDHLVRGDQASPGWQRLVIEFRVHAARDAVLCGRYAAAHARTVDALAAVLAGVCARGGQVLAVPPRLLAELALALSAGATLEQAANPEALGGTGAGGLLAQVLEPLACPPAVVPAAGPGRP